MSTVVLEDIIYKIFTYGIRSTQCSKLELKGLGWNRCKDKWLNKKDIQIILIRRMKAREEDALMCTRVSMFILKYFSIRALFYVTLGTKLKIVGDGLVD